MFKGAIIIEKYKTINTVTVILNQYCSNSISSLTGFPKLVGRLTEMAKWNNLRSSLHHHLSTGSVRLSHPEHRCGIHVRVLARHAHNLHCRDSRLDHRVRPGPQMSSWLCRSSSFHGRGRRCLD